jgi:hypothetical protein
MFTKSACTNNSCHPLWLPDSPLFFSCPAPPCTLLMLLILFVSGWTGGCFAFLGFVVFWSAFGPLMNDTLYYYRQYQPYSQIDIFGFKKQCWLTMRRKEGWSGFNSDLRSDGGTEIAYGLFKGPRAKHKVVSQISCSAFIESMCASLSIG